MRHLTLSLLIGLTDIFRTVLNHRLVVAFHVVDLHDVGRHHLGVVLMRTQLAKIAQSLVISLFNILYMSIVITSSILVFPFIHHQTMEIRHGFVELVRLEIGITHVELHLLCFVGGKCHGIGLFINGQGLLVFLVLEQIVGVQEVGMFCPSATRIVVHKLDDLGETISLAEIKRADRLVVLRVDATLRLGIGGLGAVLREDGECRTIFLVLEEQHTFVEKCIRVVFFYMLLR